jgi:preprotein translocase subunit YajC
MILIVAIFCGCYFFLKKRMKKKNPKLAKSIKTGLKILFVSGQILAALPSIVPTIQLPDNYKEALEAAQVLNLDLFQLVGVGCFTTGFNLNWKLLGTTALPLAICAGLVLSKRAGGAIAVAFLVVPSVTTTIFQIFPCDDLDDETSFLHADYSVDCDTTSHMSWVAYGALMLFVYPIGVLSLFTYLLVKNRKKLNQPDEERIKDQGLKRIIFLWEPYKPKYWWFEVFETARRLTMTGVLSAISPGSVVQLASGALITFAGTVVYALALPFTEMKDNVLAYVNPESIARASPTLPTHFQSRSLRWLAG